MPEASGNPELLEMFSADREEHKNVPPVGTAEYAALRARDRERRACALGILASLTDPTKKDLFHAAWLLNHGDLPEEAWRGHELATRAVELGLEEARWLAAASFDRWRMYSGKPQKYGTQLVPDGVRYRVWDTEPGTTDVERAEYGAPPLAEQHHRAEELTRTTPQPSMEAAPAWLKEAVSRWFSADEA